MKAWTPASAIISILSDIAEPWVGAWVISADAQTLQ